MVVEVRERMQPEAVWEKRVGLESFASWEVSLYYFWIGDVTQYSENFY